MRHPEQSRIIEFAMGRADEEQAGVIYGHLAQCDLCAQRYRVLRAAAGNPGAAWDAFEEELLSRTVESPERAVESPAGRSLLAGLLIHGLIDGGRRLAAAGAAVAIGGAPGDATDSVPEWPDVSPLAGRLRCVLAFPYAGVQGPASPRRAELRRVIESAAEHCARGEVDQAVERLSTGAGSVPEMVGSAALDLMLDENKVGEVIVQAGKRTVTVLVHPERLGSQRCFAVLECGEQVSPTGLSRESRTESMNGFPRRERQELLPVQGADYELAEFRDLPSCSFSIRLELVPR